MASGPPLFTHGDLGSWLRSPVDPDHASAVERVVWGWLRPILGVTERPADPSPELVAWAIELGAIAYSNPDGLASYALESERTQYSSERRNELLASVANGGTAPTAPGAVAPPRGCYPPINLSPDPLGL